jgi:hypothetical protein
MGVGLAKAELDYTGKLYEQQEVQLRVNRIFIVVHLALRFSTPPNPRSCSWLRHGKAGQYVRVAKKMNNFRRPHE